MFNFSGSEIVFLLLLALIVLGPEKLPEAVRKFGKTYGEIKKMTTGFQSELKSALDEPMREMRETADAFKKAASFDFDAEPEPAMPVVDDTGDAASPGAAPPIQPPTVPQFDAMSSLTPAASTPAASTPADEIPAAEIPAAEIPAIGAPLEGAEQAPAPTGLDALVVRDAPVQGRTPARITPPRPQSVPASQPIAAPMTRRTSKHSAASFRRAPKPAAEPPADEQQESAPA